MKLSILLTLIYLLLKTVNSQLINNQNVPSMVYIINRHGVIQPRDSSTHEGGALLLNTSYDRLYQKGKIIRQLYPNLLSQKYLTNDIHINSSAWERTLTTSNGILAGLYSNQNNFTANIPVYSSPWDADYTLYNYDKCPKYNTDLANFYLTPEFNQQVLYYTNLTNYINDLLKPSTPITLQNIYSTWNNFWLSLNRPESGVVMPYLHPDVYATLTEATNYVESIKMSSRIAGTYFGSTLLNAIKYRMDMFIKQNKIFGHKVIMSTAHYPTMFGLMASMGYTGPISKIIPDYNAMIVFELYNNTYGQTNTTDGTNWSFQIKFYDGDWYNMGIMNSINLGTCMGSTSDCTYDYNTFWNTYKVKNLTQFCVDCESKLPMCIGTIITSSSTLLNNVINTIYNVNQTIINNNSTQLQQNNQNSDIYNDTQKIKSIIYILIGIISIILCIVFLSFLIIIILFIKMNKYKFNYTPYLSDSL